MGHYLDSTAPAVEKGTFSMKKKKAKDKVLWRGRCGQTKFRLVRRTTGWHQLQYKEKHDNNWLAIDYLYDHPDEGDLYLHGLLIRFQEAFGTSL